MRGRIRFAELKETLEHDLGDRAGEKIPCFGTRLDLRLAMLQNPLRTGPTDELVWYVAEANALRRIRQDVSAADRARLIAETRRWVIRDLRGFDETSRNGSSEPEGDRTHSRQSRRASLPLWQVEDGVLERRGLGGSHAAGPLASVLRWGPGHTIVHHTAAPGGPAPGRAA